jgi:alkylated DNA nucleotide flippase Atl1
MKAAQRDRGVLARVIKGGVIKTGDRISVSSKTLPAWSDSWRERLSQAVELLPRGKVVEYVQLARLIGVPSTYCRAFPKLLKQQGVARYDCVVSVGQSPLSERWLGDELFAAEFAY